MLNADPAVSAYLDELLREVAQPSMPATPPAAPIAAAPAARELPTASPAPKPPATAAAQAGATPRRRRASDRVERWIGFRVAGQGFAVEVLRVLEVRRVGEITPAPGAAPELVGAINLRGQIVPVLDLALRLGFPRREPDAASRLVVVEHEGHPVGLRVDAVSEVISARLSSVEPPPRLGGRIDQGWVRGVLRHRGDSVLLLDPGCLLAPDRP